MQSGYGLDGLRAWATEGGNTNYFLHDDDTPVVGITSAGVVNRVNTFGANGFLASYSQNFTGGSYERSYAFDPQGNTSEMIAGTGSSGTLLLSATYDSFGKRSAYPSTYDGDVYDSFGAQWGYRVDSGTGFELLGYRFYDEASGRFVNRDPIEYDGGLTVLYGFIGNDPQSWIDPSGEGPAGKPKKKIPGGWNPFQWPAIPPLSFCFDISWGGTATCSGPCTGQAPGPPGSKGGGYIHTGTGGKGSSGGGGSIHIGIGVGSGQGSGPSKPSSGPTSEPEPSPIGPEPVPIEF